MAGQSPAYLPHLGLVLTGTPPNVAGDPAYLPHIGLLLPPSALSNSAGDPWPLPHWALLARTGAFTGTSSTGAFTLTGIASSLKATRKIVATAGAFTLTGQAATLTKTGPNSAEFPAPLPHFSLIMGVGSGVYRILATTGAFTLNGQAAALRRGIGLAANTGSYLFSGAPALRDMQLTAEPGLYSITGQDPVVTSTHNPLSAVSGAYVLTGFAAALTYNGAAKMLTAFAGSYAMTGNDASFVRGFAYPLSAGAFTLTFSDADLPSTGHVEPTAFEGDTAGGRGFARHYALAPRVSRQRRTAIAKEIAKKPAPVSVQAQALDVAHEWLSGEIPNEAQAQRELQKLVAEHGIWKREYERLLRAYHDELQAEQAKQADAMAANEQEYQRMQRNANAARVLLLMNM